jgi:hypothetical protein
MMNFKAQLRENERIFGWQLHDEGQPRTACTNDMQRAGWDEAAAFAARARK